MRRKLIAANWKMHKTIDEAVAFAHELRSRTAPDDVDLLVIPPYLSLPGVVSELAGSGVPVGAQDLSWERSGAFTGEVSGPMIADAGGTHVLVGHSERRHVIGEDDDLVNAKLKAALEGGLDAILCVGETLEERQAGRTRQVNVRQLMSGLRDVTADQMGQVTIAYEPVWAIGTGEVATPEDVVTVHKVLRATITDLFDEETSQSVRIQYGGSVKPKDAAGLFLEPDIDGGLIGGASLKAQQFAAIVRSAVETAG
jgi:triosephosphate isomerase